MGLNIDIIKLVSTIVQALALFTAIAAIIANFIIHQKNRNVNTVIQLTKDFYQNNDFTRDRLKLWVKSSKLMETGFKFNYRQILESIQDNDGTGTGLAPDEIVALNRTIAFYHTIRVLIKRNEVDVDMLRDYFEYNYNNFYDPIRKKLEADSGEEEEIDKNSDGGIDKNSDRWIDKEFLKEISELKSKESQESKYSGQQEQVKDSSKQRQVKASGKQLQNWYRRLKSRINRIFW